MQELKNHFVISTATCMGDVRHNAIVNMLFDKVEDTPRNKFAMLLFKAYYDKEMYEANARMIKLGYKPRTYIWLFHLTTQYQIKLINKLLRLKGKRLQTAIKNAKKDIANSGVYQALFNSDINKIILQIIKEVENE
jgi:hypothetical protein